MNNNNDNENILMWNNVMKMININDNEMIK